MKNIIRYSFFLLVLMLSSCTTYYKAVPIHKKHYIKQRQYNKSANIKLDNFVFLFIDESNLSKEIKSNIWFNSDIIISYFESALKTKNLNLNISSEKENLFDREKIKVYDHNPNSISKDYILELADTENDEIKLFPLISIINFDVDKSFENIDNPPNEYTYIIFLSVYIIQSNDIIYYKSVKLKGFEREKEDFEHSRAVWFRLVSGVMNDYLKSVK